MQSLAEFIAESFNSNVPLTWNISGVSRAVASFMVDSVKTTVAFERREAAVPGTLPSKSQRATALKLPIPRSPFSMASSRP